MPLTYSTSALDSLDEERKRREQGRANMIAASDKGVSAIEQMRELGRRTQLDDDQRAQRAEENRRADQHIGLQLSQEARQIGNDAYERTRQAEVDARQRDMDARQRGLDDDARSQRTIENERAGRSITLQEAAANQAREAANRAKADAERGQVKLRLSDLVQAGRAEKLDDRALIERASATFGDDPEAAGFDYNAVVAESARQAAAEKAAAGKVRSPPRANPALRGPGGLTDKQRREKALADKAEAEAKRAQDRVNREREAPDNFAIDDVDARNLRKQRRTVIAAQQSARSIRDLAEKYDLEQYTGPVDGRLAWLQSRFGLQQEEAAQIESTIRRAFTDYKVAATGAAAGVKEMADIKSTVPSMTDSLAQILGKLDAGDAIAARTLEALDAELGSGDARAASNKPKTSSTRTVRVSNGHETFEIERSDLADAKADGFREVSQ